MWRSARVAALAVAIAALIAGSLTARPAAARTTWDPEPAIEQILRAIGILSHSTSTTVAHESLSTIVDGLRNGETTAQVRNALRELLGSDDVYRKALGGAFCNGMEQMSDPTQHATYSSWRRFFFSWLSDYVSREGFAYDVARGKRAVDGIMNTWNLAKVNAGAASFYWRQCVRF